MALQAGDHPRSRGVYGVQAFLTTRDFGSSPLARGLRGFTSTPDNNFRIIPARAGFTATISKRERAAWDHPRSRGVYERSFSLIWA